MNAPPQFPMARTSGGPAPVRRAHSVRRTSTIETGWPQGLGQPMLMLGHARDVRTGDAGAAPEILDEAQFRIVAAQTREVIEITVMPERAEIGRLVGVRAGGQSRAMLAEVLPGDKEQGSPLYLILDDFAGASLVSGWIWSQWENGWQQRVMESQHGDLAALRQRMTNICTGFAEGSSALTRYDTGEIAQNHARVVSLRHPDDPDGWHGFTEHEGASMRRSRWIDVWREGADVAVAAGFQDSGTNPDGGRTAVHEYRLTARIAGDDHVLEALEITPHVLPFAECPGAIKNARRMIGQPIVSFRQSVIDTLPGTQGCTHLNDVLRSLAEVPVLAAQL